MPGAGSAKELELLKKINKKRSDNSVQESEKTVKATGGNVTPNTNWRGGAQEASVQDEYGNFDDMLQSMSEFTRSNEAYLEGMEDSTSSGSFLTTLREGDMAPLDVWSSLKNYDGNSVRFRNFHSGNDLVVVLADPRKGSSDMKQALIELNARFPKSAASVVAITPDLPHENKKLAKKSKLFFPVLSDGDKTWLKAYQVVNEKRLEKMLYILEPNLGKILVVLRDIDSAAICEVAKDALAVAHKRNKALGGDNGN